MLTLCKYLCCRLGAWLIVLCTGMTAASESHPCPCIPRTLCPRVFGASPVDEKVTGPIKPCSDPGTVHCCGASVSLHEQHPIHIEVDEELKKENQLVAIVNNAIERMNEHYAVEDGPREDKSIDTTKKNNLGCNTKHCSDISKEKIGNLNTTITSTSTVTGQHELFNSSNTIFSQPELSQVKSSNGSVEKVYIVYAENLSQNNAYLGKQNEAQIVLPTKEPKTESSPVWKSTTEEGENEPQESSLDPIQVHSGAEENPDETLPETKSKLSGFVRKHHLLNRKSNRLDKLFPKRRPPSLVQSKSSQKTNEQSEDDVEVAESNLDEVRDTVGDHGVAEDYEDDEDVDDEVVSTDTESQSQGSLLPSPTNTENNPEQTEPRRLPLPPRRLATQPQRSEENKQTPKNTLDFLRRRTKSRNEPTVNKPNEESMRTPQHEAVVEEHIAMEMDELNVRVINDMMKTNFTGQSTSRSNPTFKSSRTPLKTTTTNNRLASSFNRNNQEPKNTEGPSQLRRPAASHNIQPFEPKSQTQKPSQINQNHEQSTNRGTGSSEDSKVHRFQLKARPNLRTQNTKLSLKLASPISMTQEQAFDPSTPNAQVPARRQPYMRIRARPQSTTPSTTDTTSVPQPPQSSEVQTKPPPSAPLFVRKRLPARDRLRPRVENTNKNKQYEEPKMTSPETEITSKTNTLRAGTANEEETFTNDGEPISSPLKPGLDLDGSGSDLDFQQYQARGNGKFTAPRELESGFHPMPPMMESRELKVVGPLPGGFFDPASGFSDGGDIGLELPEPTFQTQFKNEGSFNQNNGPLTLLPPVIEIPQTQVTPRSQGLPQFPEAETQPFFEQEETPQPDGDLSTIQNQFGTLKNQYDALLNRYAETLNIYIGQYKKLIKSAPPNIR